MSLLNRPSMLATSNKKYVGITPAKTGALNLSRSYKRKVLKPVNTKATSEPQALNNNNTDLQPEVAKVLYHDMLLGRQFEESCAQLYYRGKLFGFVHLYSGQEAVSTGVIKALLPGDYVVSTYRDHVHALSRGVGAREVMAELFGKKTGCCRGQGGSMHIFSSPHNFLGGYAFIGEGIPVGLGAAFQSKYRVDVLGRDGPYDVTCSFFGDGTCNMGQFYECLNMAALYRLPHIFVVENNKWAIGMNHPRATAPPLGGHEPRIDLKGPPLGVPGVRVDGMDVRKVRAVALEAIARARRGEGPTLIECETYRFRGHSLADPDELRDRAEKQAYAARDPLPRLKQEMLAEGLATEEEIKAIEKRVQEEVEDAVQFAERSARPDRGQLFENVFADPRGFGISESGRYRYELPGFSSGLSQCI